MPAVATLLVLLTIAAYTDLRWQMIWNKLTYPGILLGFALRLALEGWSGLEDAFQGFFLCGGVLLVCFVFFGLGGGDVKLMAMVGAFLGWERGFEVLLWTFVLGGAIGAILLVWQLGVFPIAWQTVRHLFLSLHSGRWIPLTPEERKPLQQTLFLAPAALLATLIVVFPSKA